MLLGISFTPLPALGFDVTVQPRFDSRKDAQVTWRTQEVKETSPKVTNGDVAFISAGLYSRCLNHLGATLKNPVTGSSIRLSSKTPGLFLFEYTKGQILEKLNVAGVEGVPQVIDEEQVRTPHPTLRDVMFNLRTSCLPYAQLHTAVPDPCPVPSYH